MVYNHRNAKTKTNLSQMIYELRNAEGGEVVKLGFRKDLIN